MRIGGAGDIDIGNSTIDYVAKATLVADRQGAGRCGVRLSGGTHGAGQAQRTFDNPRWEVDDRSLAGGAAREKLEEKAPGKLRGLFKR